jgi:autotransporter passenger strand-loop-strand repeat protein
MTDYVVQNTTSTGITLSSSDTMEVLSSGIASNTTILSGGLATVFKDGITVNTTISSGGLEIVSSAAQANLTQVSSGGVLSITSEGHALSTTVFNSGLELVANGATSTFVSSGGSEAIIAGGQGFADQVLSGGSVTGVKGKVIDSLASGVPCVMTPIGAEGLDLPGALEGCIAATAEQIAAAILRLHNDEKANAAGRAAGLGYIEEVFSEARLDALMLTVLGPAIRASAKSETAAAR